MEYKFQIPAVAIFFLFCLFFFFLSFLLSLFRLLHRCIFRASRVKWHCLASREPAKQFSLWNYFRTGNKADTAANTKFQRNALHAILFHCDSHARVRRRIFRDISTSYLSPRFRFECKFVSSVYQRLHTSFPINIRTSPSLCDLIFDCKSLLKVVLKCRIYIKRNYWKLLLKYMYIILYY